MFYKTYFVVFEYYDGAKLIDKRGGLYRTSIFKSKWKAFQEIKLNAGLMNDVAETYVCTTFHRV